jgi:hypothetical protein
LGWMIYLWVGAFGLFFSFLFFSTCGQIACGAN